MILSEINCLKTSHIVAIQDNADSPAKFLIEELIKTNTSSEIHIFCYDQYYLELQKEFSSICSTIRFHDCLPNLTPTKFCDPFESFISSIETYNCSSPKLIIFIDSLSTLLLGRGFEEVYRILHQLHLRNKNTKCISKKKFNAFGEPKEEIKTQIQVVILIHEDTVQDINHVLINLKHICPVWILVKPNTVNVSVRKTSGKLVIQSYEYKHDQEGKLIQNKKEIPVNTIKNDDNEPSSTFKLTLSEREKKARDAVKLPYERNECDKNIDEGGQIFYEPDEYDDWDEEDPDNDLEFS